MNKRYEPAVVENSPKRNLSLPIYNIKAVSRMVGLLPVTLRAWERRYGLPSPNRGQQGYRLYSEHDIRTLHWLKAQIGSGLSIGRAVDYLNELRSTGFDPAAEPADQPKQAGPAFSVSITTLAEQLLKALTAFNEPDALAILQRAFDLYSLEDALTQVIQPTLVALGDSWRRGDLPIATEHYATQFLMQRLLSLLASAAPPSRPGAIVAACAPGEMHQIGLIMLVILLRSRGWDVRYLGPDLPLSRLEEALAPICPRILMFSANRVETAERLVGLPEMLAKFPPPHPLIVLGGQAFQYMRLPESIPAVYLDASDAETVRKIEEFMQQ